MKQILSLLSILPATTALAEERMLTGPEIAALLPKITALNERSAQTFEPSGETTYTFDGNETLGTWWVTETQYCSTWPPSASVACYDVLVDPDIMVGSHLIWVDSAGDRITDTIAEKE